ncbi:MAG TPA: alpha/beta hydrolase [Acidimicrobiales bacterium]|nr:alpha/beta hydrolase [Acidimicrobiales bacterium]
MTAAPGKATAVPAVPAAPLVPQTVDYAHRPTRALRIDLYRPAGDATTWPVVVWVHGGGFFRGDRTKIPEQLGQFLARGLAVASIDYRLSHEARFPAQLHDVRAAVRHLRRHAHDLGVDPAAVGLWGASAGGTLAALVGLLGHQEQLPGEGDVTGDVSVRAVAESYGLTDLTASAPPAEASIPGMTGANSPEARLFGGTPAEKPELAACASPLTHVHAGAPPFQISHGTADPLVPWSHSHRLHAGLTAAGAVSDLFLVEGYRHGFLNSPRLVDVDTDRLLDGGRLAAEGLAPARHHSSAGPGDGTKAMFGFETISHFFATRLSP